MKKPIFARPGKLKALVYAYTFVSSICFVSVAGAYSKPLASPSEVGTYICKAQIIKPTDKENPATAPFDVQLVENGVFYEVNNIISKPGEKVVSEPWMRSPLLEFQPEQDWMYGFSRDKKGGYVGHYIRIRDENNKLSYVVKLVDPDNVAMLITIGKCR